MTLKRILYNLIKRFEYPADTIMQYLSLVIASLMFAAIHFYTYIAGRTANILWIYISGFISIPGILAIGPKIQERYRSFKDKMFTTQRVIEEL